MVKDTPDAKFEDVMRILAQRWKLLLPEDREPFVRLSNLDRLRFAYESDTYLQQRHHEAMTRELKRDPKTGKPKKHHTAYQLFAQVIRRRLRAKRPNATESDRMKTISIEWAKLPPEQKRYYHDEARQEKEKYEKAFVEWEGSMQNTRTRQMAAIDERRRQTEKVDFIGHGADLGSLFAPLGPTSDHESDQE